MRLSFNDVACARDLGISSAEARKYLEELLKAAHAQQKKPPKVNSGIITSAQMRSEVLEYGLQYVTIVHEG